MSAAPARRFRLAPGADLDQLVAGLRQRATLEPDGPGRGAAQAGAAPPVVERHVLDTFDWRLHGRGSVLELRRHPAGEELAWRDLASGATLGTVDLGRGDRRGRPVPARLFAWDLPPGPVADRLAEVLDVRALLPLAAATGTTATLRMVDGEGKTVARLVVDRAATAEGVDLPTTVEVAPVRGYERQADRLADLLAAQVVLEGGADDVALAAVAAAGRAPGDYTSKLVLRLDPDRPAAAAWGEVLRTLLATLRANEAGLRDELDSEFLHDFRVAVRRARSVAGEARGILPAAALARLRPELAWLGRCTGPARDLDVELLDAPAFEARLPVERRGDLKPFVAFLERGQRRAYAELVAELASPRYADLVATWHQVATQAGAVEGRAGAVEGRAGADPDGHDDLPEADAPASRVAATRIARAHRRLVRAGRAVHDGSAPEALHELRKDAKRLRYLLECFGSLYPPDRVGPVVKELKALQDVLGEYQDCQVQAETIERYGQEMLQEGGVGAATLMAMGFVVEHLAARQDQARAAFGERFARFDAPQVRRRVKALAPAGEEGER